MKLRALVVLLPSLLVAQSAPEVEITAEPHHQLVLSNDQVRVFNVELPAHSDTAMHWHRHDYLYVQFGNAEVVNAVKDKPPVTVKLQDGQVGFLSAPYAHVARNLSDQPFHNLTIELLQDEKLRHASSKWDEDRGLDILQGGTKEILFVKDGIRVSEVELQPKGVLPGHAHAGPLLIVALSHIDLWAELRMNAPRGGWTQIDQKPGAYWISTGSSYGWSNHGPTAAKFVTLEFP